MQTPHTNSNVHAFILQNILIYVLHVLAIALTPYFDLNNLDFFNTEKKVYPFVKKIIMVFLVH